MPSVQINKFRGLFTGANQPPFESAKSLQNMTINRISGRLQLADGYVRKYSNGLPVNDTVVKKISLLSWKYLTSFSVPDHGGANIDVLIGTYTKTGFTTSPTTISRFGIWMRPWWDGSTWNDSWQEITEMFIFQILNIPTTPSSKLYIDDGSTFGFHGLTGYANVFNSSYFKDWTIVFGGDFSSANDNDNYLYVTGCGFDNVIGTNGYYLSFFGDTANLGTRAVGNHIVVYRSLYNKELPSSVSAYAYKIMSDLRLTSGNTANDTVAFAGFRTKTWGWTSPSGVNIDRLVSEAAGNNIWSKAFIPQTMGTQADSVNPVPSGTYFLKTSLSDDVGNETELRQYGTNAMTNVTSYPFAFDTTDSTYFYYHQGGFLYKVAKSDPNTVVKSAAIPASLTGLSTLAINNGIIYLFGPNSTPQMTVIQTDLDFNVIGSPLILSTAYYYTPTAVAFDSTYLYMLLSFVGYDAKITRVNISTFAEVSTITFTGLGPAAAMAYDGSGLLYVATEASPATFSKVDTGSFTITTTITLGLDLAEAMTILNGVGWIQGSYLGRVTLSTMVELASIAAGGYSVTSDGTDAYASTASGHVNRYDSSGNLLSSLTGFLIVGNMMADTANNAIYFTDSGFTYLIATQPNKRMFVPAGLDFTVTMQVSPSMIPKKARYINVYLSPDNTRWYFVKQIGLYSAEASWTSTASYDSTLHHNYIVMSSPVAINGSDVNTAPEATAELGRDPADTGVINFSQAAMLGGVAGAVGVLSNGKQYLNQLFISATGGQGNTEYDVFPTDKISNGNVHMVDLEYGDGDSLVAAFPLNDNWIAGKTKSVIMVTKDAYGAYQRNEISQSVGFVSKYAANVFEDVLYYAGDTGINAFSARGNQVINPQWLEDWRSISLTTKQAAVSIIDRFNRQWRIAVNSKEYIYDIDSGEWEVADLAAQPLMYTQEADGTIAFLSGTQIYTLGGHSQHDGANVTFSWQSNDSFLPLSTLQEALVAQIEIQYASTMNLTLTAILDGNNVSQTKTLASSKTRATMFLPLSSTCKRIAFQLSGATTADNDTVDIKEVVLDYETQAEGGDVVDK